MTGQADRKLVSEEELAETHSREMYYFIKSSLKFEKKVTIPKKVLMHPNFQEKLDYIINHRSNGLNSPNNG